MNKRLLASAALLALAGSAHAAIAVDSSTFSYSQNFDSLPSSGTMTWTNDSTLSGWSFFKADGVSPYAAMNIGTGSNTTNPSPWNLGTAAAPNDRALGGMTKTFSGPGLYFTLSMQNTSAAVLNGINLSFAGEQYASGANVAETMTLQYGIGPSIAGVSNWITPTGNFNFVTPVVSSTIGAIDGNGIGRVAGLGGLIPATMNPGDTLWLRWSVPFVSGVSPEAMGIDDVTVSTVSAVPEPGSYALMLAGMGVVGFIARRRSKT